MLLSLFLLASWTVARLSHAIEYNDIRVLREKLILYDNPRIGLETLHAGVYITIRNRIIAEDHFNVRVTARRHDGVEFPVPDNPIKLCKLLEDELNATNNTLARLRVSRAFSLAEITCPIPASKKRLMPYMFPPRLDLQSDVGCGTFSYETTIESCKEQKPGNCVPFITAVTDVSMRGDHCPGISA